MFDYLRRLHILPFLSVSAHSGPGLFLLQLLYPHLGLLLQLEHQLIVALCHRLLVLELQLLELVPLLSSQPLLLPILLLLLLYIPQLVSSPQLLLQHLVLLVELLEFSLLIFQTILQLSLPTRPDGLRFVHLFRDSAPLYPGAPTVDQARGFEFLAGQARRF